MANKPWHPLHYALKNKADDMLKKLKPAKIKARQKKAKKIKWRDISQYDDKSEYKVYVSDEYLGRVRREFNGKWKIYPDFEYEDLFYGNAALEGEYHDFRESGQALIDFWISNV